MFDIGFTEIILIALVSLIVIGPNRLPEAMRTCAMWIGRLKRTMTNVRRDLENEIGIDEIRQDLRNEQILAELKSNTLANQDAPNQANKMPPDDSSAQSSPPNSEPASNEHRAAPTEPPSQQKNDP